MTDYMHKYFDQDPVNWNILGFLNDCDKEPFHMKVDCYIKSLQTINESEQGDRKKYTRILLDRYKMAIIQSCSPSHETGAGAQLT
nr:14976_t:CDS:2 [Entrophospora candida]